MAKAKKQPAAAPVPESAPAPAPAESTPETPKKKKTAKRPAAAASASASASVKPAPVAPANTDLLSQTVLFCQEQRWREAAVVCRRVLERARNDGNEALVQSMSGAQLKIEYSLRRQMAAAAVQTARELIAKEFLLDVASE